MQAKKAVEIRDSLTLELLSTLQPTEDHYYQCHALAYSPDGCSLACLNNTGLITWDIQTGGLTKEIKQCIGNFRTCSLVWSSDGKTIGVTLADTAVKYTPIMFTVDVTSGVASPKICLKTKRPHIWAHGTSFQIMAEAEAEGSEEVENIEEVESIEDNEDIEGTESVDDGDTGGVKTIKGVSHHVIDVLEVGPTLTKVGSFCVQMQKESAHVNVISPTTYRVSFSANSWLCILDIQNSECLLEDTGNFNERTHSFSPDGSHFAAYMRGSGVHIWKYTFNHYTPWRVFPSQNSIYIHSFQFSPTLSSVMGYCQKILQAWRLDGPPTTLAGCCQQAVMSHHGTYVATGHVGGSTVTITNILSQIPSQVIETGMKISAFALTGNVLLVEGTETAVAWLLTEEGTVDGVFGKRKAGHSDSIWTVLLRNGVAGYRFSVTGHIGAVRRSGDAHYIYHTGTGEVLQNFPKDFSGWSELWRIASYCPHCGKHSDPQPSRNNQSVQKAVFERGWAKNSEGQHRLWVPAKWSTSVHIAESPHDIIILHPTTSDLTGQINVIIKF